jgi:hypothetical protein
MENALVETMLRRYFDYGTIPLLGWEADSAGGMKDALAVVLDAVDEAIMQNFVALDMTISQAEILKNRIRTQITAGLSEVEA